MYLLHKRGRVFINLRYTDQAVVKCHSCKHMHDSCCELFLSFWFTIIEPERLQVTITEIVFGVSGYTIFFSSVLLLSYVPLINWGSVVSPLHHSTTYVRRTHLNQTHNQITDNFGHSIYFFFFIGPLIRSRRVAFIEGVQAYGENKGTQKIHNRNKERFQVCSGETRSSWVVDVLPRKIMIFPRKNWGFLAGVGGQVEEPPVHLACLYLRTQSSHVIF